MDFIFEVYFRTASVRAIVVNAHTGNLMASSEFEYLRWKLSKYCDATKNQFRHHPLDYVEGFQHAVEEAVTSLPPEPRKFLRSISIDASGSTPVPVNKNGTPLTLLPLFRENPNAMFWLWKDHTALNEAEEINTHAKKFQTDYLKYVGGIYSTEWFWAKLLNALLIESAVCEACYAWVEHCDWMPFLFTGERDIKKLKAGVCAAGHKALWENAWGALPPKAFFSSLDLKLLGFVNRLYKETHTAETAAGHLLNEWAEKLGLSKTVLVGVGAMDAHLGAVGGEIAPYYLSKLMGTSTCDMLVVLETDLGTTLVDGICGRVKESVIPNMIGLEAGQSDFGEVYAWFKELLAWPIQHQLNELNSDEERRMLEKIESRIIENLSLQAQKLPFKLDSELAIDWLNGRRTPDADQSLKGALHYLSLGSDAPRIFKSLVEATCFGAKKIVERFVDRGIPIKGIIGVGGVAKKSPYIMQRMADILQMPIKIHKSEQTSALGAAMFAATVAGIYPKVKVAMEKMGQGFEKEYVPNVHNREHYVQRYQMYLDLCDKIEFKV